MSLIEDFRAGQIQINGGSSILSGSCVTRATVLVAPGAAKAKLGSLYLSTGTGGHVYKKVANAGASTDWEVVTTTAAD